jgi:hypothetical protein
MTNEPNHRQTANIDIRLVTSVEGKYGPQWAIEAQPPWSDYLIKGWLDVGDYPLKPELGPVRAVIERGKRRQKRDGGEHDGSQEWMFQQKIISLVYDGDPVTSDSPAMAGDGSHEAPYKPTATAESGSKGNPLPPGTPIAQTALPAYEDTAILAAATREANTNRRTALMQAVEYANNIDVHVGPKEILGFAATLYDWLQSPAESPQTPQTAPVDAEPPPDMAEGKQAPTDQAEPPERQGWGEDGSTKLADMNMGQFLTRCAEHFGWRVPRLEVLKRLGVSKMVDITDYAEAWWGLELSVASEKEAAAKKSEVEENPPSKERPDES